MAEDIKVAAVTGAAAGLGLGIAQRLARTGYRVILVDVSPAVQQAAEALAKEGYAAEAAIVDVGNEAQIVAFVKATAERYGRFDIMVNNAGISPKVNGERAPIAKMSTEEWQRVLNINLTSAFIFTREVTPYMAARKWGRIVNMSSRAGRTMVETAGGHYAASKAGMIGFTRVAANEFGKQGITVNCIAPGRIDTPMTQQGTPERRAELESRITVGRIGTPDEIASAVEFLVSDASWYITGTTLDVNGGTHMN
ncbi:MAG: SDR family NAD(P)-dependent oxidoreductase [Janthinobacterium lividum]